MGVATTYNPGVNGASSSRARGSPESDASSLPMSRFTALLLLALASSLPAFAAEQGIVTRIERIAPEADIDPDTGLARTTVVRPLRDATGSTEGKPVPIEPAVAGKPHIALILPTASPTLGRLAEAVRLGFVAAAQVAGRDAPPITFTPIESEGAPLVEACRAAQRAGAMLVVAGLTRDGASALARSDCPRQPVLALNEPQGFSTATQEPGPGDLPANLFYVSLSLEQEAKQVAQLAIADGWHSAIVVTSPSPLARRVQEAFEREWTRGAGELRRVSFSGNPDDAPPLRERIANMRGDMVFLALDQPEARMVRPYVSGALATYATSLGIDPRADPTVNVDLQGVRYADMPWFVLPDHPAVMVYPAVRGTLSVDQERLYALGIDALRLSLLMLRGEPVTLDGVTGRIALAPGNAFVRTLTACEVDGGRVVPVKAAQ
jgi:outer membrane PBP1 activator LpoA protein